MYMHVFFDGFCFKRCCDLFYETIGMLLKKCSQHGSPRLLTTKFNYKMHMSTNNLKNDQDAFGGNSRFLIKNKMHTSLYWCHQFR